MAGGAVTLLRNLPLHGVVELLPERVPQFVQARCYRLGFAVVHGLLEHDEEFDSLAMAEFDRLGCADGVKAGPDPGCLVDAAPLAQEPTDRLPLLPGEGHRAAGERDSDAVETHRHGSDSRRAGRVRLGHKWASPSNGGLSALRAPNPVGARALLP